MSIRVNGGEAGEVVRAEHLFNEMIVVVGCLLRSSGCLGLRQYHDLFV